MLDSESPLDRRLLDALNDDGHPAPLEARARVRARLAAVIPAMRVGAGSRGDAGGSAASAPRTHGGMFLGRQLMAGATFVAGAATGMAIYAASSTPAVAPRMVSVERPQHAAVAPTGGSDITVPPGSELGAAPRPVSISAPASTGFSSPAARTPAQVPPPRSGASPQSRDSQVGSGQILLDEARAGLVQGDPERALARIDMHRAKYPDGRQTEEREALRVGALAGVGRHEDARRAAAAFHMRWPGSIYAATVDGAISSIP